MPERVRRRVLRLAPHRRRRVELGQLNPAVAVRGPQHRDVGTDVLEPDGLIRPRPLDLRLAFEIHAQLDKERLGGLEVVDNDEHVVHPLERHFSRPPWSYLDSWCFGITGLSWCRGPRSSSPSPAERSRAALLDMRGFRSTLPARLTPLPDDDAGDMPAGRPADPIGDPRLVGHHGRGHEVEALPIGEAAALCSHRGLRFARCRFGHRSRIDSPEEAARVVHRQLAGHDVCAPGGGAGP